MIVAVTSRRGGTGCSTISLVMSSILKSHLEQRVCLVDLKDNNDTTKLIRVDTSASINNLISDFGLNNRFTTMEENLINYNGISILPGVKSPIRNYLLKKTTRIKELLLQLEKDFDVVVVDVEDGELYRTLLSAEVNMLAINVLEQNSLVMCEYQEEMASGFLQGVMILNKVDARVWPYESLFRKAFSKDRIFLLPYSAELKSTINHYGVKLDLISNTKFFEELMEVCKFIKDKTKDYNEKLGLGKEGELDLSDIFEVFPKASTKKKSKKKGFFSSLFKKNGGAK